MTMRQMSITSLAMYDTFPHTFYSGKKRIFLPECRDDIALMTQVYKRDEDELCRPPRWPFVQVSFLAITKTNFKNDCQSLMYMYT